MQAMYFLIPLAIVLVAIAVAVFFWAVDSGQYEDLDRASQDILFDDDDFDTNSEIRAERKDNSATSDKDNE